MNNETRPYTTTLELESDISESENLSDFRFAKKLLETVNTEIWI